MLGRPVSCGIFTNLREWDALDLELLFDSGLRDCEDFLSVEQAMAVYQTIIEIAPDTYSSKC